MSRASGVCSTATATSIDGIIQSAAVDGDGQCSGHKDKEENGSGEGETKEAKQGPS